MVKIRLKRMGAHKKPFYRVVVADSPQIERRKVHRRDRLLQPARRAACNQDRRRKSQEMAGKRRAAYRCRKGSVQIGHH